MLELFNDILLSNSHESLLSNLVLFESNFTSYDFKNLIHILFDNNYNKDGFNILCNLVLHNGVDFINLLEKHKDILDIDTIGKFTFHKLSYDLDEFNYNLKEDCLNQFFKIALNSEYSEKLFDSKNIISLFYNCYSRRVINWPEDFKKHPLLLNNINNNNYKNDIYKIDNEIIQAYCLSNKCYYQYLDNNIDYKNLLEVCKIIYTENDMKNFKKALNLSLNNKKTFIENLYNIIEDNHTIKKKLCSI